MTSQRTITQEVAEFILSQKFRGLPRNVVRESRRCILDGLAVMLAGSTESSAHVIRGYLKETVSRGPATVVGSPLKAQTHLAALANGTSGHAMDYDDTQLSSTPDRAYGLLTHPTVPVLAAALAVGQEVGASGKEVFNAFCTGFEVECKIAQAISPKHYQQGFHSTGTMGGFGAAATAAKLWGLTVEQTRMALGIAASKAAGLRVNFGTMTKPLHAGAAAENGVVAARLARLGYTADPSGLDGQWGFFQVTAGGCEPEYIVGKLGKPWSVVNPGVSVKPYPCGSLGHPSMDAMLDLVQEYDVKPDRVEEIRVGTTSFVLAPLRYMKPQNALEAKFSIPFMMAILVLRRKAGIEEFKDDVVLSKPVREMMGKVKPYLNKEIEAKGFDRIRSVIEIKLKGGRVISREAEASRGSPMRPMTAEEMEEKFRDCAKGVLSTRRASRVLEAVERLEGYADINEFMALLRGK
ncbi:MAG: MmgE/PrpD family protein [Chloroflexi bacterium]|nr:MmgE/PrpD family protein [Chloroflexota bacterium]